MESTKVKAIISLSQDGNKPIETSVSKWDCFLNEVVDDNTDANDLVDVENVIGDYNYMINQLQKAINSLPSNN